MFASRPGKTPATAAKNAFSSIRARPATPSFARRASLSAQAGTESLRISDGGRPLAAGERGEFEPRFGFSFANVRVHDGAEAANSAKAVGARAFTLGNHIVFAPGAHAPGSEGRATLAHELAHVVQHGSKPAHSASTISSPADAGEREAEMIATKVRAAESGPLSIRARISPSVLHRQSVHMASGRFVGDKPGAENNQQDEVIRVLDKLAELGAISQTNYEADYKAINALPPPTAITPATIPNTIAGIKAAEEPTLDVASAKKELNVKLWNDVGKGRENNKVDVLAIQDQLHAEWHLADADYKKERATVGVLARDAKVDGGSISKTLQGISEQKIAILGGQTGPKYRHGVAVSKEMESLESKKATWTISEPGRGGTFDTWAMAKDEQSAGPLPPVAPTTTLNCSEMVLLAALRLKLTTWKWVHDLYVKGAKAADWSKTLVDALSRGARTPYSISDANTPRPNRGQVVFFNGAEHVALANGQTKPGAQGTESGLLSFWPPPRNEKYGMGTEDSVQETTIEAVSDYIKRASGRGQPKIEFSHPPW
jgi:hypothetical protein